MNQVSLSISIYRIGNRAKGEFTVSGDTESVAALTEKICPLLNDFAKTEHTPDREKL